LPHALEEPLDKLDKNTFAKEIVNANIFH